METFVIRITPHRGKVEQHQVRMASANAAIRHARKLAANAPRLEVWRNAEVVFMSEDLGSSLPARSYLQPCYA
jgi:hypothetical protein